MVSDLFKESQMDKKRSLVKAHYGAAYEKEMRLRGLKLNFDSLPEIEIEKLYKELQKLHGATFIYEKKV